MDTTAWQLWLIAAIVLGALEIKLPGFVTLWFAVGALMASLMAGVGLGLNSQLFAFILVSAALFGASRTIFKHVFMRDAVHLKTGVEAMLGQEAVVMEALADGHGGTVRINGELWMARSLSGPLPEGERVTVEQIEGLKLWVRRPSASNEVALQPARRKKKENAGWD
ncbi:NfeD family protein [Corallococcus exiguus]|uniref:NfeD family protein n=1 Tax=Corallococcus TaxID=83461 RepID=UPI000EBAC5B7|nr:MULTISPECIES: NfeD family protein [Corallococcus]NNB90172.1 NfeD family protein [Corallococcus exiguus]NNB99500.1 NfeD family protein [Corallococcus exiguus]NNC08302.1 NfeD family protein [Corallococcus exiguus]NPC52238.1 NfeD family protein [Corallococcus exiguus]RKH76578.1 NfeD family protein [Corallococcus sp. AB032C]